VSKDLLCVSIVDDLEIMDVSEVDGSTPRTLRVQGRAGFRTTVRLDINGFRVDTFTVVNDKVILVVPGDNFADMAVSDMAITAYSSQWSGRHRVRLVFGITQHSRSVSGVQKLVQQIVKGILTSSGSNRYAREEGGSLLQGLGQTLSPEAKGQVAALVAQAISVTEANFLSAQASERRLSTTERLLKLELLGLDFLPAEMEVRATVRLRTMAGATVDLPLTL